MNTQSGTEVMFSSSDWRMGSELGYFACSLISGFKDDTVGGIFIS